MNIRNLFKRKNKSVSVQLTKASDSSGGFLFSKSQLIVPSSCTIEFSMLITDEMMGFINGLVARDNWSHEYSPPIDDIKRDFAVVSGKGQAFEDGFKAGRHCETLERFNNPEEN